MRSTTNPRGLRPANHIHAALGLLHHAHPLAPSPSPSEQLAATAVPRRAGLHGVHSSLVRHVPATAGGTAAVSAVSSPASTVNLWELTSVLTCCCPAALGGTPRGHPAAPAVTPAPATQRCQHAMGLQAVTTVRRWASAAVNASALHAPEGVDLAAAAAAEGADRAAAVAPWSGVATRRPRSASLEPQEDLLMLPAATVQVQSPVSSETGSHRLPDLTALKVSELKAALRILGVKSSARKKAELVQLLSESHDRAAAATVSAVRQAVAAEVAPAAESDAAAAPPPESGDMPVSAVAKPLRKAKASRRGGAAAVAAPEAAAAAAGAVSDPNPDPALEDLFAAMDLDISVTIRGSRETRALAAAAVSAAAAGSGDGSDDDGDGSAVRAAAAVAPRARTEQHRRTNEAAESGVGLDSAPAPEPAASASRDGAEDGPPRPLSAPKAAAAMMTEAGTVVRMTRRRTSQGSDTGPGPTVPAEAPARAAAVTAAAATTEGKTAASSQPAPAVVDSDSDSSREYDLPPWPAMHLGEVRRIEELAPGDRGAQEELLLGNVSGMSLTVLGSAAVCPTVTRALASLAMSRVKDIFIFDAGDDTQRQVAAAYHVKPSKVFRIFLTSLQPECVLGLPGLMCVISSSRERGHEIADIPVHVYGPPGTANFLAGMMRVSHTYLEVTIVVHEISTQSVPPAESVPYLYFKRARIWRVAMPPDQLNPRGGIDASLLQFAPDQGRSQKKRGRNASGGVLSFDPRAGFLPFPPLEPGNQYRRDVDPESMTWTLDLDNTARVIISLLPDKRDHALSYTILEADRAGALVMERATAAGLRSGPGIARLKAGEPIRNSWGDLVPPELVISPIRPGRRVVVLGNTPDPSLLTRGSHPHMGGADVLVAGAVWPQENANAAELAGGCTTDAVGRAAQSLGARYVLLCRFDGCLLDEQEGYAERMATEVAEAAAAADAATAAAACRDRRQGGGSGGAVAARSTAEWRRRVFVVDDLDSVMVDKNEGPREREDSPDDASMPP